MKQPLAPFLILCLFTTILLPGCSAPGEKVSEQKNRDVQEPGAPNIVLILADDMAYADVSSFGSTISTPNLDGMASEGIKLTHFYVTPNCSPTRASLLTGCYPQRVGIPRVLAPQGPAWAENLHGIGLNPREETVAELLKKKGYATGYFGKWHLGDLKQHLPPKLFVCPL